MNFYNVYITENAFLFLDEIHILIWFYDTEICLGPGNPYVHWPPYWILESHQFLNILNLEVLIYSNSKKRTKHQIEKYFWFPTFSLRTLLLSVPQPAPIGGLPYHWLNGGSSSDHLLPRHAGSKPQRGLGETDKDLQ